MATAVLHPDPQAFPIGTTVKVRKRTEPHAPYVGEPPGSILSEPVVASGGTLTVTVTAGELYVGFAEVGGAKHYLYFNAAAETGGGGGGAVTSVNTKTGAVVLAAVDVGADAEGEAATRLAKSGNLSELGSATTSRTNLGLGTAATQPSSAFDSSGLAAAAQAASTPKQKKHALVTTTGTTAVANEMTPVETGASNLTIKLPEGASEGALIGIIKSDAGAGEVTIEGKADGAGAAAEISKLRLQFDGRVYVCLSDGTWTRLASHVSIATLDGRYISSAAGSVGATNLGTNAVTAGKIKNEEVTAEKLGPSAVEEGKIKANAVARGKLSTAVQEELEPKTYERSWVIEKPSAKTYNGFQIKIGHAGEAKKLTGVSARLLGSGGTSKLKIKVLKGGTAIGGAYSRTVEQTATTEETESVTLADKDVLTLTVEGLENTPEDLRVSIYVQAEK